MKQLIAVMLIVLTSVSAAAASPAKRKHHNKATPAKSKPVDTGRSVVVFSPHFEPSKVHSMVVPFFVGVRTDDARKLSRVRVRLFPNKDLMTVKRTYLDLTPSGCRILGTRIMSYQPTFAMPDIPVNAIYPMDMRCDDNRQFLVPTKYVLVVESDDGDDNRFLQLDPDAVDKYFHGAYVFTINPKANTKCETPAFVQNHIETDAQGNPVPTIAGLSRQETSLVDAKTNSCVTTIK
jgi:hypothetical protein